MSATEAQHTFGHDRELAEGTISDPRMTRFVPVGPGAVVRVQVHRKDQKARFDESDPTINTKIQWKKMHEAPGAL